MNAQVKQKLIYEFGIHRTITTSRAKRLTICKADLRAETSVVRTEPAAKSYKCLKLPE